MPNITIPNVFADGTTTDADDIAENLYRPAATPNTPEVINGWLDNYNFASKKFYRRHLQPSSHVVYGMQGSTACLDYPESQSNGWRYPPQDAGDPDNDKIELYRPIPGACAEFYCDWQPKYMLFTWNISYANRAEASTERVHIRLGYTNLDTGLQTISPTSIVGHSLRECPRSVWPVGISFARFGAYRMRHYSGHHLSHVSDSPQPAAGRYQAGLYIAVSQPAATRNMGRVHVRSFRYICFR